MRLHFTRFITLSIFLFAGINISYAATYDWVGATGASGDKWTLATNWVQGIVPAPTDNVRIGAQSGSVYTVIQAPTINTTVTVASITFGCNYGTLGSSGITVKTNSGILTVTNDITVQSDSYSLAHTPDVININGTNGTITATNLAIIANTTPSASYKVGVTSSVSSFTLTNNINLTANDDGTGNTYNAAFVLTGGIASVANKLKSTVTANATALFQVNPSSSAGATLQLANNTALSALSATGTNTIDFNNTYSTIEYSGTSAQTIYSTLPITGLPNGVPSYYSLKLSGNGIKNTNGNGYDVIVNGDFTNTLANNSTDYAIFTTSLMRFIGNNTQNLYAGAGTGTTFKKVNFNQGSTKNLVSGNFYISSDGLLLMNGSSATTILNTNGLLTLLSDAGSTATIGNNNTQPTIVGNVNVQRFITGGSGYRGYRLLSSPVNINTQTAQSASLKGYIGLSYLNSGILTAGPGTGFSVTNANPLIYLYDESRTTNNKSFTGGKNIGITSITDASGSPAYSVTTLGAASTPGVRVPVGNSFLLYYVGSTSSTVLANSRTPDNATSTAVGYLNQGTIPVIFWNYTNSGTTAMPYHTGTGSPLSGVNQMGNPYPSTITLTAVYADNKPLISPVFYELNEPGNNYISYNASDSTRSDTRASRFIVSGQGFLSISTGTSSTFTFYEDQKVPYPNMTTTSTTKPQGGTLLLNIPVSKPALADDNVKPATQQFAVPVSEAAFVEGTNKVLSGLHLQLSRDSNTFKQTGIYFAPGRSDKYDNLEDAVELGGPNPQVYLSSYSADGVKLSINELGNYIKGKSIKLFVKSTADGLHAITLADVQHIDTGLFHIFLVDNLQKDSVDIAKTKGYAFTITNSDTTTFGADRFVLSIRLKKLPLYKLLAFAGQKVSNGIHLNWKVLNAGNYTGFTLQKLDANNNYDSLYSIQSDSAASYDFTDGHPVTGNNTYRLAQNDATGNITYSAPVTIGYSTVTPDGMLSIYPNPAKAAINVNLNSVNTGNVSYSADIYSSSGILMKHKTVNTGSWSDDVSSYKSGIYIMLIKDTNGNVITRAKFSKID